MDHLLTEPEFQPLVALSWRPGIGDPTVMGWITVALYFCAAFCSYGVGQRLGKEGPVGRKFWNGLSLILLLLGINKQLDVQSFLTDIGRTIAKAQGWYGYHRVVQAVFIAMVTIASIAVLIALLLTFRRHLRHCGVVLLGIVFLVTFVVIRAASFHHVDQALGFHWSGVTLNVALECSGLLLILLGAAIAAKQTSSLAPSA